MEITGERLDLNAEITKEAYYYVQLMHKATYNFALKYVKDKKVLDYGCGTGYGSQMLAMEAATVTAVDICKDAIEYAKNTYTDNNLHFKMLSEFDSINDKFDVITSFQVIEHIAKEKDYIVKLKSKLKPGGYLIISTPNKSNRLFRFIQKPWNIFHIKEYSDKSLYSLLNRYFSEVKILKISSIEEFVKFEVKRTKRAKLIFLPSTLFFYPNFLRVWLIKTEKWLIASLKRTIRRKNIQLSSNVLQQNNPVFNYTIDDIQISENPAFPTDLIAICKSEMMNIEMKK